MATAGSKKRTTDLPVDRIDEIRVKKTTVTPFAKAGGWIKLEGKLL